MRLFLSSFGLGNRPDEYLRLLRGGTRVGVVLNAKDGSTVEGREASLRTEMASLRGLGLEPFEIDLRTRFGRPDGLASVLSRCDGVWVRGGNTFVLRRAFRQSGFDIALGALLREDAVVYGGFSAAAAVLGHSLRGIDLVDDPSVVPAGYEPEVVWDGLGLLPYAIVPHYRSDHPESASVEMLAQSYIDGHVPFVALRDGEAIVIDGRASTRPVVVG